MQHFILYSTKITKFIEHDEITGEITGEITSEINMKQISEDLKSFLTIEMGNNAKEKTEKIIKKMDTNFELSTRIETIDRNAEAAETLAKQNQNSISNLARSLQLFKKN